MKTYIGKMAAQNRFAVYHQRPVPGPISTSDIPISSLASVFLGVRVLDVEESEDAWETTMIRAFVEQKRAPKAYASILFALLTRVNRYIRNLNLGFLNVCYRNWGENSVEDGEFTLRIVISGHSCGKPVSGEFEIIPSETRKFATTSFSFSEHSEYFRERVRPILIAIDCTNFLLSTEYDAAQQREKKRRKRSGSKRQSQAS